MNYSLDTAPIPPLQNPLAHALDEVERLSSSPETVDVMACTEYGLLAELQHWLNAGYYLSEHSVQSWAPGDYYVLLHRTVRN